MTATIIINSEFFGVGDNDLGTKLMGNFLRKLWSLENKPERIIFYNSGVKLLAEGSAVLDALNALTEAGVDLIACGTCVTHFELKGKLEIGRVSDMQEIASTLLAGDAVTV
jgi:selenium metabolism protein YedF